MSPNDHVLDFMLSQLRQHVQTNYTPVLEAPQQFDAEDVQSYRKQAQQQAALAGSALAERDRLKVEVRNLSRQNEMLIADLQRARAPHASSDAELQKLRSQLAACHENQAAYRAEIAQLNALCKQKQGHVEEANAALLAAQEELNTLRTKKFGAAMGIKDVNALVEQLRIAHEELRRRDTHEEGEVVNVGQWDGSIQIGSDWHKDAS